MINYFSLTLLFRGSRDGFEIAKFHERCDNQGPLLVIIKTQKDILVGGFSSISWKNVGGYVVDPKCVVFSITRKKIYNRLNDNCNVHFGTSRSALFGNHIICITNKQLMGYVDTDPFKIPKNGSGESELVE
jgi:hypothetical protein